MTQIPKMNPEGFEVAAKVWNDRYVELSKNVAGDQEKQTKHLQLLADEIQGLLVEKANLIAACDEALDWADANARAFPIETMPIKGLFLAWDVINGDWEFTTAYQVAENEDNRYTHWTPLPPPPSNPPLPEPLERLGEVLRQIKGEG